MAAGCELHSSDLKNDDIAVIGLACRFPGGASNEAGLWDLLSNRKCEKNLFHKRKLLIHHQPLLLRYRRVDLMSTRIIILPPRS
jgi:hypothetical protein